jgi:radical SAM superfamily enzyme YgiQ (UPF0313 family)
MVVEALRGSPFAPVFTPEFGFNGEGDWSKASLRGVFLFPSPVSVKLEGRSPYTLYGIVKSRFGDEVFVDICMQPPQFQLKAYFQKFPAVVGAFSRRTWEDFDVVAVSAAVTSTEFAEAYRMLSSAGFPLDSCRRREDKVSPLLVLGGVAAGTSNSFDEVADLIVLGLGERSLVSLCGACLAAGDVPGSKPQIIEAVKNKPGFCSPLDFSYGWHITDGHVESYPAWAGNRFLVEPDVSLDIESLGGVQDVQRAWPVCGKFKRASLLTSWGCAGGGACYFCAEGSQYGAWRERSLPTLAQALQTAKRSSMGESVSFQSFNSSFHSRFPELLLEAFKYFDHLSVLNFRLDALATSVRQDGENNYLRVMKEAGSVVVAGAVEGFGERVRNNLYNKNLSFEDALCVAEEVFKLRFMKFKTGYILSGHETGNDLKEGLGEIRAIAEMKRRLFGRCQYVVSVSKLVHYFGTPLYRLPRAASLLNWSETFGGKKIHYPFMDLPRELVSVKSVSGIGDTFIQQLHQDLPAQLSRELLLEPALLHPVMSRGYLDEVKRRMEGHGIKPREQFINFQPEFNPKQHYRLSKMQGMWDSMGDSFNDFIFKPRQPCLKTVSSEERGSVPVCYACRSCVDIDRENPRLPDYHSRKDDDGHWAWLRLRELGSSARLSQVRAVKAMSKPSFFYTFIFWVGAEGRLVSKDVLARLWFKELAAAEPGIEVSFRKLVYSFSSRMDYPDMVSNYYGYEVVTAGFSKPLDVRVVFEKAVLAVDRKCPTIRLSKIVEASERPSVPGFWVMADLTVDDSVDAGEAFKCFKEGQKFRLYSGSTYKHSEVSLPFYWGLSVGAHITVILPAKANPAYSLMGLWSYNKFNSLLKSQNIRRVFLPAGDGLFLDAVTGEKVNFERLGYVFMDKQEDEAGVAEPLTEIQGA